jgi:4-methyl-5(b-hydroxyethyl)-thiazole monophosphate biosynthesis
MFLAQGFEEVEALAPLDLLRRAGLEVTTVGIGGDSITGSHGITVKADVKDKKAKFENIDMVILPGGMPGTLNLNNSQKLCNLLKESAKSGVLLAAICAAPSVLGNLGLLKGKNYTCYPSFEKDIFGGNYTAEKCVADNSGDFPVITAKGPGAANEFAFAIVDYLTNNGEISINLKSEMQF